MKTLIIYDETGIVISTVTGEYTAPSIIVADVPDGYEVTGVNTETGEAILTPRPATEAERTAAIEKQMMAAAGTHAGTYDDPIPFVYGMAVKRETCYNYAGMIYQWAGSDCTACVWLPDSGIWQWTVAADPAAAGTVDDPIPASRGMDYTYGRYYSDPEDGKVYLCSRAGEAEGGTVTLQYLPHELVGNYFVEG